MKGNICPYAMKHTLNIFEFVQLQFLFGYLSFEMLKMKNTENINKAEEKKSSVFDLVDEEDDDEQPEGGKKFLLQPCNRISFNAPFAFTQKTHIRIVNTSDVPFAWMLIKNVSSVIFISPQNGYLQPDESIIVDVAMNPFKGELKKTDKLYFLAAEADSNGFDLSPFDVNHFLHGQLIGKKFIFD
ncbi:hypothetical protein T11_12498 [Trichinella zimbabwensis]|uniref:Major sperm protein n=1 Tax=Trichinella zimbabwensis TaxID=268475 RepID=A0A0V1HNM6_9BILA|nr:hypothetical protein T11_12498 [Trichinella zimbabwensis]